MIIGFLGLAGSGKDTASDMLVKEHGFVKVACADPLKRICKNVFDFSDEQLWGPSAMRNAPDFRYPRLLEDGMPGFLTPRYALQQLGTEWGRNCYDNVWIDYAIRTARCLENAGVSYDPRWGILSPEDAGAFGRRVQKGGGVAISDVRFQNEVDAIRAAGGKIVKLTRGAGLEGEAGAHRSEKEQASIPPNCVDSVVDNRAYEIEDLRRAVRLLTISLA